MPFSSSEPRLVNGDVGLHNLVARSGHNAPYAIDVTLLDAPDHRLIRSGVLLAHRVLDGRGEWFLTAPDWQPLLPKDRIELMGHADLPDDLAELSVRCAAGPHSGRWRAELRPPRVRAPRRRGHHAGPAPRRQGHRPPRRADHRALPRGDADPGRPGLSADQRASVDRAFRHVGANRVPRFPRLVTRLGAPATGSSDIPAEQALDGTMPFRRFVAALVGNRLREIVRCDLALRGGDADALARLTAEATALRAELSGLSPGLDPAWVEDLTDDLDWLVAATRGPAPPGEGAGRGTAAQRALPLRARTPGRRRPVAPPGRRRRRARRGGPGAAAGAGDPAAPGGRRPAAGRRDRRRLGPGPAGGRTGCGRSPGSRPPCSRTPPRTPWRCCARPRRCSPPCSWACRRRPRRGGR